MLSRVCLTVLAWAVFTLALALPGARAEDKTATLAQARKGHTTQLVREVSDPEPLVEPPPQLFSRVTYAGPLGKMAAYVGAKPAEAGKHPAIVWITGGFPPGGIGADAWGPRDPSNDQSARAFRLAGMVLMVPTMRGSFGNPGHQETFFGEVDDVLAAADYLAKLDYVDPKRIYLGGHSTGGTLALLVAASSARFKGVFAFGPVDDPAMYGFEVLTYDPDNEKETRLRAPIHYLESIRSPTWVIECADGGNSDSLLRMQKASKNPRLSFVPVRGANHFDVLDPVTRLLADRAAKLDADATLGLTPKEIQAAFDIMRRAAREADDLETLARLRRSGADLATSRTTGHYLLSRDEDAFTGAAKAATAQGFAAEKVAEFEDSEGDPYYVLVVTRTIVLSDLSAVFKASAAVSEIGTRFDLEYDGWGVR